MIRAILLCLAFCAASLHAQWIQSSLNPGAGRSLHADSAAVFAATYQGVYYTAGTGEPWLSIGPEGQDIMCVTTVGSRIIAGGDFTGVFVSTNTGQTWYQPSTLSTGSMRAMARTSSYLFAGTWGGGVFRSSDNGESWEKKGLDRKGITALLAVGTTLFAGEPDAPSKVYSSTDNGNTWNVSSLSYPADQIRSMYYDGSTLFACDAGLYASTDMGKTWTLRYGVTFDSTGYPVKVMLFRSVVKYNQILVASVDFESMYISTDNGFHWMPFNDGIIKDWTFVDVAVYGTNIWGLRDFTGTAYRRPVADLITGVNIMRSPVSEFTLMQNYPNPFNPSTMIRYALPHRSHVTLAVYNTLGQQVAQLVNSDIEPGYHEIQFNATKLASGLYFYRIQAGSYVETKRLMLLR